LNIIFKQYIIIIIYIYKSFLRGYKGDFSFEEIGLTYTDGVPYVTMRLYSGLCGILVIPVCIFIVIEINIINNIILM